MKNMKGKICVVTGANSGIGKETALELARRYAHLVIIDIVQANTVAAEITAEMPKAVIDLFVADLSDQQQVHRVANEIDQKYNKIDVLINNAGRHIVRRETSTDGFEMNLALNCLAPFLLTQLLLDKLIPAVPSCIVNVASEAHRVPGRFSFDDINTENESMIYAYGKSKIANILWMKALSRRLEGTGVTINAVCPGLVATNIFDNYFPKWVGKFLKIIAPIGVMATAKQGARMQISLATGEKHEGISGEYFGSHSLLRHFSAHRRTNDITLQEEMWDLVTDLTGLSNQS